MSRSIYYGRKDEICQSGDAIYDVGQPKLCATSRYEPPDFKT